MKNDVKIVDRELKAELLLHYSERDPNLFFQMDAFVVGPKTMECSTRNTYELMHGADVRILISAKTKHEDAVQALKLLLDKYIENADCKRCGGRNGEHHPWCSDEDLSDEQVQAVVAFDNANQQHLQELPF